MTGAVTLTGGTNVTLTQSGQDISIAASASAGPGTEIGYDQITGNVTVSSATEATGTTIITCAAHTFDGSPVYCEFFAVAVGVFDLFLASLFEGSTQIGRICQLSQNTTALPASGAIRFTPSAGSHTFSVTAWRLSGNATVFAGAGGTAAYSPCFVRFTKV